MKINILIIFSLLGLFSCTANSKATKSALIIVDMQNCFVSGEDKTVHSLAVNGGRDIVKGINQFQDKFDLIVATYDWHPAGHVSFASSHDKKPFTEIELEDGTKQALWPDHCVQNTKGAELIPELNQTKITKRVYKGSHKRVDSYSGFFDNAKKGFTDLDEYLKANSVTDVYVVGLAADFCVKFTALDSIFLKYNTYFVKDLTKAVFPENIEISTYKALREAGVEILESSSVDL